MTRRRFLVAAGALLVSGVGVVIARRKPYPSDLTPEGAYLRIAHAVAKDDPRGFFAYLEDEAQWASYTIRDMRAKATKAVETSYPEPERSQVVAQYRSLASAPDGSDAFAILYAERGWSKRIRRDLSGIAAVEIEGDRASVVTARGTRWPFRRRKNGIWGITIYTAELLAESEKATRDLAVVEAAAADYARARSAAK